MAPKILVASRLPQEADATVEAAARLAEQVGAELALVYVAVELSTIPHLIATAGEDPDALRARMIAEVEERARDFLEKRAPGTAAGVLLVEGEVAEQIARVAREEGADYLVIGTEGRSGLKRIILGSTTEKILRLAPCPVLVVPPVKAGSG